MKFLLVVLLLGNFIINSFLLANDQSDLADFSPDLIKKFNGPISKKDLPFVKKEIFSQGGKSVVFLTEVMKSEKYPDKNRWIATFLLGQLMGEKSAPYIARYTEHPNWLLRMASLKTLTALKQKNRSDLFVKALKDDALLVRIQAIESIRTLNLQKNALEVWNMLYDKRNYYETSHNNGTKRTNIIKLAVSTVGDLQFQKAKPALYKMASNKKYEDIFPEIDYALTKMTGKKSPEGPVHIKRFFWQKENLSQKEIL